MLHVLIETAACTKLKQEGRLHNVTLSQKYTAPTKNSSKWSMERGKYIQSQCKKHRQQESDV